MPKELTLDVAVPFDEPQPPVSTNGVKVVITRFFVLREPGEQVRYDVGWVYLDANGDKIEKSRGEHSGTTIPAGLVTALLSLEQEVLSALQSAGRLGTGSIG